jgi:hypothetical protein
MRGRGRRAFIDLAAPWPDDAAGFACTAARGRRPVLADGGPSPGARAAACPTRCVGETPPRRGTRRHQAMAPGRPACSGRWRRLQRPPAQWTTRSASSAGHRGLADDDSAWPWGRWIEAWPPRRRRDEAPDLRASPPDGNCDGPGQRPRSSALALEEVTRGAAVDARTALESSRRCAAPTRAAGTNPFDWRQVGEARSCAAQAVEDGREVVAAAGCEARRARRRCVSWPQTRMRAVAWRAATRVTVRRSPIEAALPAGATSGAGCSHGTRRCWSLGGTRLRPPVPMISGRPRGRNSPGPGRRGRQGAFLDARRLRADWRRGTALSGAGPTQRVWRCGAHRPRLRAWAGGASPRDRR